MGTPFSSLLTEFQPVLNAITICLLKHGPVQFQPPSPDHSSEHLRIGRLVCFHGLPFQALNSREALVFGPEQNGLVPVRLVEASDEVRATVDWNKDTERVTDVANKVVEVDGAATYSDWCGESCVACFWIIDHIQTRKVLFATFGV